VITLHGSDVFTARGDVLRTKGYPERYFVASALKDSGVVVSPSKWVSDYVLENYHVRPVVIPNGVDTKIFRPLGTSTSRNVILFVGRFIEEKGISDLMKVARALPEYEFLLAGKGPLEIPALPNVKNLGFHENTVPLYAAASVCVFPSLRENFPLVGLEAMACGKAVVATKGGFSEYIENGRDGILLESHDVQALVNSIRYLMEDETTRRRFERNARSKAAQYDWSIIAEKYGDLYESL